VSIDINSGRSTREYNIEQTAYNTNLEAAQEIARQLRLRDMAGLVVIDFIDMEQSGHVRKVEKAMKEALKNDRARIQVGRISSFGLMEMSRQRLRTGVLEASTRACPHCEGTGLVRTAASSGLSALRVIEDEAARGRGSEILLRAARDAAVYLLNKKRAELAEIEHRYGVSIQVVIDDSFEGAKMAVESSGPKPTRAPMPIQAAPEAETDEEDEELEEEFDEADEADRHDEEGDAEQERGDRGPRKRRRRRRGGRGRRRGGEGGEGSEGAAIAEELPPSLEESEQQTEGHAAAAGESDAEESPKPKRRRRRRGASEEPTGEAEQTAAAAPAPEAEPAAAEPEAAAEPKKRGRRKKVTEVEEAGAAEPEASTIAEPEPEASTIAEPEPAAEEQPKPKRRGRKPKVAEAEATPEAPAEAAAPVADNDSSAAEGNGEPRRGWWQRTFG
jgi:ribonuclease E